MPRFACSILATALAGNLISVVKAESSHCLGFSDTIVLGLFISLLIDAWKYSIFYLYEMIIP